MTDQPLNGADSDPREYRIATTGLSHIRRESLGAKPWTAAAGIMQRGGIASYCGLDVSALPVSWGWQDRTCSSCLHGYFADDEAE